MSWLETGGGFAASATLPPSKWKDHFGGIPLWIGFSEAIKLKYQANYFK
jgi:hypothetical protein